jgi:hypothetical protein
MRLTILTLYVYKMFTNYFDIVIKYSHFIIMSIKKKLVNNKRNCLVFFTSTNIKKNYKIITECKNMFT